MSKIFGGSKSKSTSQQQSQQTSTQQSQQVSKNLAYPWTQQTFSPMAQTGTDANQMVANLLGLGDTGAANKALDQFKDTSGYNFALDSGMKAVNSSFANRGAFQSGAALKKAQEFGVNLGNQTVNDFINRLLGLTQQGLGAGQLIGGTGGLSEGSSTGYSQGTSSGTSTSTSKTKPGLGGIIGQVAGGIAASDRRLKTNIQKIGELKNGLNLYQYNYISGPKQYVGVMADEVEKIKPEALGPVVDGYKTVDYSLIWE